MKVAVILGAIAFAFFLISGFLFYLLVQAVQEEKATDKKLKEYIERSKKNVELQNEIHESMETGNSADDFNNSVNILHNFAKGRNS